MKILKRIGIGIVVVYILIVVAFESFLGYSQPEFDQTIVLTTYNDDGEPFDRVITRIVSEDKLYVRVNHWPRAWLWRLQDNPDIKVNIDGETGDYLAIEVEGAEYDAVNATQPRPFVFRLLTGFPPTSIIRLDPKYWGLVSPDQ